LGKKRGVALIEVVEVVVEEEVPMEEVEVVEAETSSIEAAEPHHLCLCY
jgi:hypothetical protein